MRNKLLGKVFGRGGQVRKICKCRVLIIYATFNKARAVGDPSVWYRCYNLAEKLQEINVKCDLISEDRQLEVLKYLDHYTSVIFFRPRQSKELLEVISAIKDRNIQFFASYDDLIFDPSTYGVSSTLKSLARRDLIHSRYRDWANAFEVFDNYIVSTNYLRNEIKKLRPRSSVKLIENFLPVSTLRCFSNNFAFKGDKVRVGYFGGGVSHKNDILSIQNELFELCKECNVSLVFPSEIASALNPGLSSFVESFERLAYDDMLALCNRVDVCIAPLKLDSNSKAKSAIKYTEAIAGYSPLVATPIDAYKEFKKSPGLYYAKKGQWKEKIIEAASIGISNKDRDYVLNKLDSRVVKAVKEIL